MKKFKPFHFLVTVSTVLLVASSSHVAYIKSDSDLTPHDPIWIWRNGSFTEKNGVVSGSGSQDDPYIIEGWEIDATDSRYGIYIAHIDKYFIIRNCKVYGADEVGIHLDQVRNGKIENCEILDNAEGLLLKHSSNNVLEANISKDNRGSEILYGNGISLRDSHENTLVDNATEGNEFGIVLLGSTRNVLKNNVVVRSDVTGILLQDSSNDNLLKGNLAEKNNYGIVLFNSSNDNTLKSNTARQNSSAGIGLNNSSNNNLLRDNRVVANKYGIRLYAGSSENRLENNTANGNEDYGITVESSDNNVLIANSVEFTGIGPGLGNGLRLRNSEGNVLENNITRDNAGHGILLSSSDDNILKANTLNDDRTGISLYESHGNILEENTVEDSSFEAIEISHSNNNILRNNKVYKNADFFISSGISLSNSTGNTLESNEVQGNANAGIILENSNGNILKANLARNNAVGVELQLSDANKVIDNIVTGSSDGISLVSSNENDLNANKVNENDFGIMLERANKNVLEATEAHHNKVGIDLRSGEGNVLRANIVENNKFGILLNKTEQNTLENNTVQNNTYGDVLVLDFVPGELLVKFKESVSQQEAEALIQQLDMKILKFFSRFNIYHLCFLSDDPAQECRLDVTPEETLWKVDAFNALPQVKSAEPNARFELDLAQVPPSDERYSDQWYLTKIGIDRAWGAGITFSQSVVVAIIDTGVDLEQPDLMENLIPGEDFVNNDPEPEDNIGHGTFVAGLIGAVGDNGQGVSGISWHASLLPLKVADREAWYEAIWRSFQRFFGKGDDFIEAMDWLLELKDEGVAIKVINFSARTARDSDILLSVIKDVTSKDILFVTVSGSRVEGGGWDNDQEGQATYPCNYPIENLICVGASTEDDRLADFSNYGSTSVDLVAPGTEIISLVPSVSGGSEVPLLQGGMSKRVDSLTGLSAGTSFSAALVSGVATLLFAICPAKSALEAKGIILESVEKNGNLEEKVRTGGRLKWPGLDKLLEEGCNVSPRSR